MRVYLSKLQRIIDARPPRERIFILLLTITFVYMFNKIIIIEPLVKKQEIMKEEIGNMLEQQVTLESQLKNITLKVNANPNQDKRREQAELERQQGVLDNRLHSLTKNLISPRRMAQVLHDILTQEKGVQLIGFSDLPVETLISDDKGTLFDNKDAITLYKHGFMIELQGDYFSTINYLKRIENLEWRLYWDSITYTVVEYPLSQIKIKLYTLSTQEEWIGV